MESFVYNANPSRVIFGPGSIQKLPQELERLQKTKPILLCGPNSKSRIHQLESILQDASVQPAGLFAEAAMHTPTHTTDNALEYVSKSGADSIVSFGGGSAVGLGKAIGVRTGLKHICIPTTYAGSEMTPVLGETKDGRKTTRSDPKILPATVIYDVEFTMALSADLSATSGINALAHAVEALYSKDTNPIVDLMALESIKALAESLPDIVSDPSDVQARLKAQYGAWLSSTCLATVGVGLHHKLCHVLGGSFGLGHSETHTIVLPHAIAYNSPEIPLTMKKLAAVLPESGGDAIQGLNVLLTKLKVKRGLKELGMREEDIDKATEIALSNPYWNPRRIEETPLRETIRRCWAGEKARADL